MSDELNQSPSTRKRRPVFALGCLVVVIVGMMGLGAVLYGRWSTAVATASPNLNPVEAVYLHNYLSGREADLQQPIGTGSDPVAFTIAPGEGANQIANNLAQTGLLNDAELFVNYARYYGLDSQMVAGDFLLNPQATIPDLANALTKHQTIVQEITLNFLAGWRTEEMARYLEAIQPAQIDPDQFLAIVNRQRPLALDDHDFLTSHPDDASLEGYLFPDSYTIATDTTADELVTLMLTRFGEQITPAMRQAFGAHGLSLREAIILASVVGREGVVVAERPFIAGVFLNRLAIGMPLQADPTVQYALGYQADSDTWWKNPLTWEDLQVDSPYNTYMIDGLPLGPIMNPSLSSLQAVAEPAESDYYFFVADCAPDATGLHLFSETYEEHEAKVLACRE